MSLYDYKASQALVADDPPFYALIMAAARKADTHNLALIRQAWPDTIAELEVRYHAPGGMLPDDFVPYPEDDPDPDEFTPADEMRADAQRYDRRYGE